MEINKLIEGVYLLKNGTILKFTSFILDNEPNHTRFFAGFLFSIKAIIPHVLTNKPPQDWKIKHSGGIML